MEYFLTWPSGVLPNYLQIKYNIFLPSTFVAPPSSTYRTLRILETFQPPSAASLSRPDNWISLSSTRGRLVLRRSAARCWMKMVSAEFCQRPRKILILRVDPSPRCVGGSSHFLQVLETPKDKLIFVSVDWRMVCESVIHVWGWTDLWSGCCWPSSPPPE